MATAIVSFSFIRIGYSGFDSALYKDREAEWLFLKQKAALHDASDVNK